MNKINKDWLLKNIWIFFGAFSLFGTLVVLTCMPHDAEIVVWQLAFKMLTFLSIILCIALFPNNFRNKYMLLLVPFVLYLTYLFPRISYLGYMGIPLKEPNAGNDFYTHLYLLLFPSIVMVMCFAYRIGGGTPGNCIKIAAFGIVFLFSGHLDLMWFVINPIDLPELMSHSRHIQMFFKDPVTWNQAVVFALAHIPVLVLIVAVPMDKWMSKVFKANYK